MRRCGNDAWPQLPASESGESYSHHQLIAKLRYKYALSRFRDRKLPSQKKCVRRVDYRLGFGNPLGSCHDTDQRLFDRSTGSRAELSYHVAYLRRAVAKVSAQPDEGLLANRGKACDDGDSAFTLLSPPDRAPGRAGLTDGPVGFGRARSRDVNVLRPLFGRIRWQQMRHRAPAR